MLYRENEIISRYHEITVHKKINNRWPFSASVAMAAGNTSFFNIVPFLTAPFQPGLTKIRDTVTLFNLLKRDQGHVFSKFWISIVIICRVTKQDFQTKVPSGSVLPNVP